MALISKKIYHRQRGTNIANNLKIKINFELKKPTENLIAVA